MGGDELEHLLVRDLVRALGSRQLTNELLNLVVVEWAVGFAGAVFYEETDLGGLQEAIVVAVCLLENLLELSVAVHPVNTVVESLIHVHLAVNSVELLAGNVPQELDDLDLPCFLVGKLDEKLFEL
jgi:hypothetical protein